MNHATFRFYAELNDFLPLERQYQPFTVEFFLKPSIKDVIESLGVPHGEVDLLLVNGQSVDLSYLLQDQDRISVYPVFESFDISSVSSIQQAPLRHLRFALDANLGQLAKYLRLLGFDSVYFGGDKRDIDIILQACNDGRVILTRDKGLLKDSRVTHGYWVRATDPKMQIVEVLQRFHCHEQVCPMKRCLRCNTQLEPIEKCKIINRLPPRAKQCYNYFHYCRQCDKIYWQGSHYQRMMQFCRQVLKNYNHEDTLK